MLTNIQFEILTKGTKKPIKLQLPIVMATYPVRNSDGTLKRRKGATYPNNLPILRPWMSSGLQKQQQSQLDPDDPLTFQQ